jgi:O-antigen/teichoic acid export membrane protein
MTFSGLTSSSLIFEPTASGNSNYNRPLDCPCEQMADLSELLPRVKHELIGQIVTTVLGAALIFLLARLLGPEQYGLLFLAISILGFTKIFSEAGVANSGARYIAEYKEDATGQIRHILRTSLLYNLVTIFVVVTVFIIGHRYIATMFNEHELTSLLLYGVLFIVFGTLTTYTRTIPQGFEEIQLSALIHVLNIFGRFVFAIGLVILGYGVWGALTGYIVGYALVSIPGLLALDLRFYRYLEVNSSIEPGLRKRIAEYSAPLTVTSAATGVSTYIDTILIGFFLNPASVGFYILAKQFSQFVETPAHALGFSLAPTYGAEKAQDDVQRASNVYETSLRYTLVFYIPAAGGLVLIAEPMIRYVFSPEYLAAVPVLRILAIYIVFRSVATITADGLNYLGRARSRALIETSTVVLNVLLNILLIPRIGIVGAAIATVISYTTFTAIIIYIISLELDLRHHYLLEDIFIIFVITGIMCGGVVLGLQFVTSLFSLFWVILFGVVLWGILSDFAGLLDFSNIEFP